MNYLREINAFYNWLETNSLSDSAVVLWHALMHTNNKAGWVTEFTVAISTLQAKTGLGKTAIVRARQRLQQAGRIEFRSRSGQQSAMYRIIPFEFQNEMQPNCVPKRDTNGNPNRSQTETRSDPITKPNKIKQELQSSSLIDNKQQISLHFQKTFGRFPNDGQVSKLADFIEKGMETELVFQAMNKTHENGKDIQYSFGILKNQLDQGIRTVTQAEQEQAKRKLAVGGKKNERYANERRRSDGTGTSNRQDQEEDWNALEERFFK